MPTQLVSAAASSAHESYESSLLRECVIASAILILLLCLWERRRLAFWCWAFYSPRKRDSAVTVFLVVVQIAVIAALTSIVPVLSHTFGVTATREMASAFLIVEAVTAGAAAVAGLGLAGASSNDEEVRALLQRAGRSALDGLGERARDSVPGALTRAVQDDARRRAFLQRLRLVLAEHGTDPTADLITRNVAQAWPVLSDDLKDTYIEAVSRYVIANRIPPHRLLR